jgi:hypothetical protein
LWNVKICASWYDNPSGTGLMLKLVFVNISMRMLLIAVDEQLLNAVGKSTILYKLYDDNTVSNWSLL